MTLDEWDSMMRKLYPYHYDKAGKLYAMDMREDKSADESVILETRLERSMLALLRAIKYARAIELEIDKETAKENRIHNDKRYVFSSRSVFEAALFKALHGRSCRIMDLANDPRLLANMIIQKIDE